MASSDMRRGALIEGINVTPLVDITLVLLVIFIVTAKVVVSPAVPVDLPQMSQGQELQSVLSIAVPVEGPMLVDGQPLADEALEMRARAVAAQNREARAVIQADRATSHGRVMSVLDRLKGAGLTRVAFAAVRADGTRAVNVNGSSTAPAN